tara:strand:- start:962 stop:1090 length:129 start_codon:yes stop_codon:yes gene_type:complete
MNFWHRAIGRPSDSKIEGNIPVVKPLDPHHPANARTLLFVKA